MSIKRYFRSLLAGLVMASPALANDELINCLPSSLESGGDFIDRGFYIPSYPGVTLEQVFLWFNVNATGTYEYRLTARENTFDGAVLGSAEVTYTFSNTTAPIPIIFDFGRIPVALGTQVTFAIAQLSGPGDTFYQVEFEPGCPIVQTNGTSPPLDSQRREGIYALVFGSFTAPDTTGVLESPQPGATVSGIGLIRGWVCDAVNVEVEIDGDPDRLRRTAYGTSRNDTIGVCGDADNGFGLLFNWNLLGTGFHSIRVLADGVEVDRAEFRVQTLGVEFLTGVDNEFYILEDFPFFGEEVDIEWVQDLQNFVIIDYFP